MIISVILIVAVLAGTIELYPQDPKPLDPSADKRIDRPIRDELDGEALTFEEDKPRIDRFAEEIKNNKSSIAYIIAYAGSVSYKNEARIRLRCIRDHLKTVHGIASSRLRLIDGGYRVDNTVRLYLVQPGDPTPTPYALVNREAVRMRRAPRNPCGTPN